MNQKIFVVAIVCVAIRFFLATQDSYIHPDEHFQNFSVINNIVSRTASATLSTASNINGDVPWEFSSSNPARSMVPLYLIYYPFFKNPFTNTNSSSQNVTSGTESTPLQRLYYIRLLFFAVSWATIDYTLIKISTVSTRKNLISMVLVYSSYVIWTYQSHTFSNSVETMALLFCLVVVNSLKVQMENYEFVQYSKKKDDNNVGSKEAGSEEKGGFSLNNNFKKLVALALLINFGIFNRTTFVAFLVFPSWYLFSYFFRYKKILSLAVFALAGISFFIAFSYLDTMLFEQFQLLNPSLSYSYNFELLGHRFIVSPLNNLRYNTSYGNLAKHGIHPRYTHITINLLQMLGPLYLVFLYNVKDFFQFVYVSSRYCTGKRANLAYSKLLATNEQFNEISSKAVIYAAVVSGLVFLSLFPHQELRFLLPLQPLMLKVVDFEFLNEKFVGGGKKESQGAAKKGETKKQKPFVIVTPRTQALVRNILYAWYLFNVALGALMGVFHQGGVIPALDYIRSASVPDSKDPESLLSPNVQVWWRTYPPPTWLLGTGKNIPTVLKYEDQVPVTVEKTAPQEEERFHVTDNLQSLVNFDFAGAANGSNADIVIDTMGMDLDLFRQLVTSTLIKVKNEKKVLVVCPVGSFEAALRPYLETKGIELKEKWAYLYHLDMDHLDVSLKPGIGIYQASLV